MRNLAASSIPAGIDSALNLHTQTYSDAFLKKTQPLFAWAFWAFTLVMEPDIRSDDT